MPGGFRTTEICAFSRRTEIYGLILRIVLHQDASSIVMGTPIVRRGEWGILKSCVVIPDSLF